jgi:hypothetical protein
VEDFHKNQSRADGLQNRCKVCVREVRYQHVQADPEHVREIDRRSKLSKSEKNRDKRLRSLYGINVAQYDALLASQSGRCAICWIVPRTRRLAVDHNHKTGEVRGLLCTFCNHKMLGGAKERPEILRRGAEYLETPPARAVLRPSQSAQSGQSGTLS